MQTIYPEKHCNIMKLFQTLRFQTVTTVSCLALIGAIFTPNASASDWDRKTEVTFSASVAIPGVHLAGWAVLPAGTYVFKILDSQSDRHIVQIFNQDRKPPSTPPFSRFPTIA